MYGTCPECYNNALQERRYAQEHVGLVAEIEENWASAVGVARPIAIAHDVSLLEGGLGRRFEAEVVERLIIITNAARGQVGARQCRSPQQSETEGGEKHFNRGGRASAGCCAAYLSFHGES